MFTKYTVLVIVAILFISSSLIARTYNKRSYIKKSIISKFLNFIDKAIVVLKLENKYNNFLKKLSIVTGKKADELKERHKRYISFMFIFNTIFIIIVIFVLKSYAKGYLFYFLVIILLLTLIIIEISIFYISYLSKRKKLDDQTVVLLEELLIEYKIHHNVIWAFQESVKRLSGPMKHEIEVFIRHLKSNKNVSHSISFLASRIQNKWMNILKVIVAINYEKGGDMTGDLMYLSKLYQEEKALKSELKAMLVMFKITSIFMFIAFPILFVINAQYNESAYELYFVTNKEILVIVTVLSIIPLIITSIYEKKL